MHSFYQVVKLSLEVEGVSSSMGVPGAEEARKHLMNEISKRIFELIHSKSQHEKLGGVAAMGGYQALLLMVQIALLIFKWMMKQPKSLDSPITFVCSFLDRILISLSKSAPL
jgi:hypothetical protein